VRRRTKQASSNGPDRLYAGSVPECCDLTWGCPKFAEQQGKTNDNLVARQSQLQALEGSPAPHRRALQRTPAVFWGAQGFWYHGWFHGQ
jgi:hypothetical protein